MVDVVLRAATVDDAAALSALDVDVWRASYRRILSRALLDGLPQSPFHDPQYFLAIVDRSGMDEWLWVIEAEDALAGYCHFGACKDPGCGYLGEIARLYLRPAIQGQGIGTRILGAAAHRLVDEGLVPIRATVFEDNRRARRLYERLGAEYVGRQVVFEDQGKPVWDCTYGWADPAALLAAASGGVGKDRQGG